MILETLEMLMDSGSILLVTWEA